MMEEVLQKVREFADTAHGEQMRKYTPDRYIVHPVRVMEICRLHSSSLAVLCAALLHDVLEDTPVNRTDIYEFLKTLMPEAEAHQAIELVVELTDVYTKAKFPKWNRKKRRAAEEERMSQTSPEAQTIKYADIMDNCREIVGHDPDFARVFLRECRNLLQVMMNGHPELYRQAKQTVQAARQSLSSHQ
jgi:guanosine-3',5'-bis(diphosphate) 3'-pyrophosphohydrolase